MVPGEQDVLVGRRVVVEVLEIVVEIEEGRRAGKRIVQAGDLVRVVVKPKSEAME